MSVKYNVVERPNPSNPQARKKFYPSLEASGRCTQRQLAELISHISTVSTADTMAVIEGLLTVIPQELAAGNVVELGDFGSFWLKANAMPPVAQSWEELLEILGSKGITKSTVEIAQC